MTPIYIQIPSKPQGKGRARSRIVGEEIGKQFVSHYTPGKTRKYEALIASYAQMAMVGKKPITSPVKLALVFVFEIPSSWPKWKQEMALNGQIAPTVKPDGDNVEKAVKDAFNGIVWHDDSYVVKCNKEKRYGLEPCVNVRVEALDVFPAQIKRKPKNVEAA